MLLGIVTIFFGQPPTHIECCYALALYVAPLQHIFMLVTNAFIYVVVDLCNATNDNAYKSVGVDLSNAYMDIRQHINALLKGVLVVVTRQCIKTTHKLWKYSESPNIYLN